MPAYGRKWYKLTELFTTDEIHRAMILFLECKRMKEDFNYRCAKELVEPVIARVNEHTEDDNSPEALVCRLEMYIKSIRGEKLLIRH